MYFKIYIIELSFCLETIIHVTILEYVLFAYMRHFDKRQTRNYLNLFSMKIKKNCFNLYRTPEMCKCHLIILLMTILNLLTMLKTLLNL